MLKEKGCLKPSGQLQRLETIKKLKAAKARQQVYEQIGCSDDEIDELLHQHAPLKEKGEIKHEGSLCYSPEP